MLENVHKDEHRLKLENHLLTKQIFKDQVGPGAYEVKATTPVKSKQV